LKEEGEQLTSASKRVYGHFNDLEYWQKSLSNIYSIDESEFQTLEESDSSGCLNATTPARLLSSQHLTDSYFSKKFQLSKLFFAFKHRGEVLKSSCLTLFYVISRLIIVLALGATQIKPGRC
jgi:hypothetical protein